MRKRSTALLIFIYLICAATVSVHAAVPAAKDKSTGDEKGFSAEDLKRFLEESGELNDGGEVHNDREGRKWKDYLTLSDNSISDDKTTPHKDEKHDDVSGNNADASEEKDDDIYIPSKDEEWKLILVNKQNPIPSDYDAELVDINGGARIRREIALPLAKMFDAAEKDGVTLTVCSAYRSHEYQEMLFDKKIRNYTKKGMSYLDAFRIGSYSVIIPGTSEHELGMALDIVTPGYMSLDEGYADTAAGKWLKKNAYKYGFVLRYPEGKEYITGIIFEPWHYRYVGTGAAKYLTEKELTLEEYTELLEFK